MDENLYDIVRIVSANGGFGEWRVTGAYAGAPVNLDDFRIVLEGNVYELGKDILPEGFWDIRGSIKNQPDLVFAVVDDNHEVKYYGANKI